MPTSLPCATADSGVWTIRYKSRNPGALSPQQHGQGLAFVSRDISDSVAWVECPKRFRPRARGGLGEMAKRQEAKRQKTLGARRRCELFASPRSCYSAGLDQRSMDQPTARLSPASRSSCAGDCSASPQSGRSAALEHLSADLGAGLSIGDYRELQMRGATVKEVFLVSAVLIEPAIYRLHVQRVILSCDLTVIFDVQPRVLTLAARRYADHFPLDFVFVLFQHEWVWPVLAKALCIRPLR